MGRRARFSLIPLAGILLAWSTLGAAPALRVAAAANAAVGWGDNQSGQVGDGSLTSRTSPTQVFGLTSGVTAVAAGALHSLAVVGGGVKAWGNNFAGQLGDGTTTDRGTPVSVSGLSNVVAVAAGDAHSLALLSSGTVMAWGDNAWGQLGDGTTTNRSTPVAVSGLSNVVAVSAGGNNSLALLASGTVMAWGANTNGQLGNGATGQTPNATPAAVSGLSGIGCPAGAPSGCIPIAAGSLHALAIVQSSGAVMAWGSNSNGQLGNGTTTDSAVPVPVTGVTNAVGVAAGAMHSVAVLSDGTVSAWGANSNGQLGNGTNNDSSTAVTATGVSGAVAVAAGGNHTLALTGAGGVEAWGFNLYGQLGNGSTTDSNTAVAVPGVSGVAIIAAKGAHSLEAQASPLSTPSPGPFPPGPVQLAPVSTVTPANQAAPPNVLTTSPQISAWYFTGFMASDPVRPGHLAISYTDATTQTTCWLSTSSDNGQTWTQVQMVGATAKYGFPTTPLTPAGVTFNRCFNASVAFGPDGTLYYVANPAQNSGYAVVLVAASKDDGNTFLPFQQIDTDAPAPNPNVPFGLGDYRQSIVADSTSGASRGGLYFGWGQFGPFFSSASMQFAACSPSAVSTYLAGGSLTCDSPVAITPVDPTVDGQFVQMAEGPDGAVYYAWDESNEVSLPPGDSAGPYDTRVVSTRDQGHTFTGSTIIDRVGYECPNGCPTVPVTNTFVYVSIAVGPAPGQVYVASGGIGVDGHDRVSFVASQDGGSTWPTREEVGVQTGHQEYVPQLGVAPDGRIDLAYCDADSTHTQNCYLTSSTSGGASFTAPQILNDTPSNADLLNQNSGVQGNMAVLSSNTAVQAAWLDSRRGTLANGKTDIAFTTVSIPGSGSTQIPTVPVGSTPIPPVPATGGSLSVLALLLVPSAAAIAIWLAFPRRRRRKA